MVEKKYLQQFFEEKVKLKLNLKNGKFFTGIILELGEHSLLFLDKYNNKLPFEYDSIAYVDIVNKEDENGSK